ncbi:MAG: response regulator [Bacteroidota bacterium]
MHIKPEFKFSARTIHILLADDDEDDRLFFKEALDELGLPVQLTMVENGEQLMAHLSKKRNKIPDVLFLDLDMPLKNGFACLAEIKLDERLQRLPVIILSTFFDEDMLNLVYKDAAHYYIRKPTDLMQLKKVLLEALTLISQKNVPLPAKAGFILAGNILTSGWK